MGGDAEPGPAVTPDLRRLRLDTLLRELMSRAEDVLQAEGRLNGLLDAVVGIATDLSLPMVLRRIVQAACDLAHAEYGALGVLGPDREVLSEFLTIGVPDDLRATIGDLPHGKGILRLLIVDPKPLRLADLTRHPQSYGFPPGHPPMRTFLGVPIRVRGEVFGNLYLTEKIGGGEFTEEDQELVGALAAAAGVAIENARLYEETRRRQAWLGASTQITGGLLAGEEPRAALRLVAERALAIAGADLVTILTPTADGTGLTVQVATGELAGALSGRHIPADGSLAGHVLRSGEPVRTDDARTLSERLTRDDELPPVGPAIAVPLGARERPLGVLTVSNRHGGARFTPADAEMVAAFAGHAALAMEFARAHADRERLAVFEDRDRIARDLHDLVIQRLFAVGLGLQGMQRMVEDRPRALARLEESVEDLDKTVQEIRRSIFSLQSPRAGRGTLRSKVLEVCSAAAGPLGFEPHVRLEGPLDSVVPDDLADHVVAVLRETLTNAARHAGASRVEVLVRADPRELSAQVRDDGGGIDPAVTRRSGLANLRSRAESLGGTLHVDTAPGAGTTFTWTVPLGT